MPYKISQRGEKWCVVKDDGSDKAMGCHDTKSGAQDQLAALYANEPEAEVESLIKETMGTAADPHHLIW